MFVGAEVGFSCRPAPFGCVPALAGLSVRGECVCIRMCACVLSWAVAMSGMNMCVPAYVAGQGKCRVCVHTQGVSQQQAHPLATSPR